MRLRPESVLRGLLFTFVAFLCFWQLGSAPLNETDEGFAANRAASFFRHDTFLVSFDDLDSDAPQFRKPPALYWAVAACLKTLGWNLWAVRLPTAAAGFGCCVLFYLLSRRALGELVAQLAVLAFATTPFVLLHIRTAMLELPLFFLILCSVYFLLHHPERAWGPVAAGLTGAAAILLKGGAGLLAPVAMTACALAVGRPFGATIRRVLVALLMTALPLVVYVLMLSPELRVAMKEGLVDREAAGRISRAHLGERLGSVAGYFVWNLRWQVPAAGCGLLLLVAGLWRNKPLRAWAWLAAVLCVPVVLLGAKQVVPYPRYFLPVYPFVAALSAYFCFHVLERRLWSLLLVPFAVWSASLEPGVLRWTPVAAAAIVLAIVGSGRALCFSPRSRGVLAALFFAAVSWPSYVSALEVGIGPKPNQRPLPAVARLARLASEHLSPGEKLVVGSGFTCHTALFYSRHALLSFRWWLCHAFVPGSVSYGLFADAAQYEGLPALRVEEIAREDSWRLVRLTAEPGDTGVRQVLLVDARAHRGVLSSLDLLEVGHREFDRGFLVTSVVDRVDRELAGDEIRLATPGGALDYVDLAPDAPIEWVLPSPRPVSGADLVPLKKQESVAHFTVEAWSRETSAWREVARVNDQPDGRYDRRAGRLVETTDRLVRIRFAPVNTDRLRLAGTGHSHFRLAKARVLASDPAPAKETAP